MINNDIVPGFDDEKDESLKIKIQKVPDVEGCLVLTLNGYIDTYNSNYFQKRINKTIEAGFVRLIFHCGGLNYVSSTGIGSFTTFLKAVKPKGGDMILLEIHPKVYEVFQLLGFSRFFQIKDSLDDSIGFFRDNVPAEIPLIFPNTFPCPVCTKQLKAIKPGRFRCSECKTVLSIDYTGKVLRG
jgi:anti-anti-sigma factor